MIHKEISFQIRSAATRRDVPLSGSDKEYFVNALFRPIGLENLKKLAENEKQGTLNSKTKHPKYYNSCMKTNLQPFVCCLCFININSEGVMYTHS